jgi:hypothetical protein
MLTDAKQVSPPASRRLIPFETRPQKLSIVHLRLRLPFWVNAINKTLGFLSSPFIGI